MGIFSRLSDIINSNINAMLDRAEDPEKIVRLIIQEMEDTLVEVRTAAARHIAEKKEIVRKLEQLDKAQAEWAAKAELAIERGREDLAKGALMARNKASETAEMLKQELVSLEQALTKTDSDMSQLQEKLNEAKAKQKAMDVRRKTVGDRVRVRAQLHDNRINEALSRYEEIERKLDTLEGEAESYDLGRSRSLEDEFATLEAEDKIERELADLKARLGKRD